MKYFIILQVTLEFDFPVDADIIRKQVYDILEDAIIDEDLEDCETSVRLME